MASYLRLVLCAFFNVDFNIDPFCAFGFFFCCLFFIASGLCTRPYQLLYVLLREQPPIPEMA